MSSPIQVYLEQLKSALAGSDPALVQDALADAEEHLATAVEQALAGQSGTTEEEVLPMIVERYGTPNEVASAYREIETHTKPALAPSEGRENRSIAARFFGVLAEPRTYGALLYMILSLVTGIIYFTWAVTGFSLSVGLIILIIGIFVVGFYLISLRGIALVEGRIVEGLLGVRMPRRPLFSRKGLGLWGRFKELVADRLTWTALAYMIIQLPLGIVYFTLAVILISVSLGLIAYPVLALIFDLPIMITGNVYYYIPGWALPFVTIIGFLLLVLTMHLARLIGHMHGAIAKLMLVRE
jgi:uncharacterized membrane protein